MIGLDQYSKIKDNYCICYFGYSDEYLVQMRLLRPVFESNFPGLNIYFGCKDDKSHFLGNQKDILKVSDLKMRKREFAHVKELRYNGETHPLEDLLVQSGVTTFVVETSRPDVVTAKMTILTSGNYPTVPLVKSQIERLSQMGRKSGFYVEVDSDWSDSGWVVGVESVGLFEAAAKGIRTGLVPTGVGTRLYHHMFPNGEVIKI